jgi:hypothetical protein
MMHLSITHGGATVWAPEKVSDDDYKKTVESIG